MEFEHQFYNLVGVVRLELRLNCPISYFAREKKMYKSFFYRRLFFSRKSNFTNFRKDFLRPTPSCDAEGESDSDFEPTATEEFRRCWNLKNICYIGKLYKMLMNKSI